MNNRKKGVVFLEIIIALVIFVSIGVIFIFARNPKKLVEKTLEKEYGKEFTVLKVYKRDDYSVWAVVKMDELPNRIFEMAIENNYKTIYDSSANAPYKALVADTVEQILSKDLANFYPDFWVRVRTSYINFTDSLADIKKATGKELIKNANETKDSGLLYVKVFINRSSGTYQKYEEEYTYLTSTVREYEEKGEILPFTITYFWASESEIEEAKYNAENNDDVDAFYEVIESIPFCYMSLDDREEQFIGNVEDFEEKRRELENE